MRSFANRHQAGRELAAMLDPFAGRSDVIVLALPRGGVPVGFEVARAIGAPLDVFTVRKLGAPLNEEYAIGAIAAGGIVVIDQHAVDVLHVDAGALDAVLARERREFARREKLYRHGRAELDVSGRTVIVVDDGLATGTTMQAAVAALRAMHAAQIIVAAPVASREACAALRGVADACVCVRTPEPFYGVGRWYDDFAPTTDAEVLGLLDRVGTVSVSAPMHATRSRFSPGLGA